MTTNENERVPEGIAPVAAAERASAPPSAYSQDSTLDRVREAEGYVIADVVGDVGGSTAPVNYAPRWYAGYLGNGVRS